VMITRLFCHAGNWVDLFLADLGEGFGHD
jgi:hypothetical protein